MPAVLFAENKMPYATISSGTEIIRPTGGAGMDRVITEAHLERFYLFLTEEEKSPYTIAKYLRDVRHFAEYTCGRCVTKELTAEYKQQLVSRNYAAASINSMLASLRSFFLLLGWEDCAVRSIRQQRKIYCPEEKELTREEYIRLLAAAEGQPRLKLIIETICATGIRISELAYFTLEAVRAGEIPVSCKNKTRTVLLPKKLRRMLLSYADAAGIRSGVLFRTRSGRAIDRSNIWTAMKKLCGKARVLPSKVFPHNLRKLFARCFYEIKKDIAKLADILGHSNINTTRIYIISSGSEHRRCMEKMKLVI